MLRRTPPRLLPRRRLRVARRLRDRQPRRRPTRQDRHTLDDPQRLCLLSSGSVRVNRASAVDRISTRGATRCQLDFGTSPCPRPSALPFPRLGVVTSEGGPPTTPHPAPVFRRQSKATSLFLLSPSPRRLSFLRLPTRKRRLHLPPSRPARRRQQRAASAPSTASSPVATPSSPRCSRRCSSGSVAAVSWSPTVEKLSSPLKA